jgi:transposase
MMTLPPSVRVFLAMEPADMRCSFDRLAQLAKDVIKESPLSGHLFCFKSRASDRVKILWWSPGGYCLFYRRLEKGVFRFPDGQGKSVEISARDLTMILEGIDLSSAKRRKEFVPAP